ncbi:transposase [Mariprofundus ferrooxydans]|nr:transposase [Mariprofundus ferrooxydans]
MARPLRVEYPGALYHITSRGNAQADIFLDDEDREMFLHTFAGVVSRFAWVCHAYCLMGNHYHLVIETPAANLCAGMRQLNGVYTQRFNRKHQHVGHIFQGRYKSILVERDAYLLELCRYVVLNPVRANVVKGVHQWLWSSYGATAGVAKTPDCLCVDWLLSQFGGQRLRCVEHYVQFIADGLSRASIWDDLSQQVYLAGDDFIDQIKLKLGDSSDLSEVPKAQWQMVGKSLDEYVEESGDRQVAMARAYLDGGYRMNEIARCFGVHYATVSRAVKKVEK